jgi:hypothetical protein
VKTARELTLPIFIPRAICTRIQRPPYTALEIIPICAISIIMSHPATDGPDNHVNNHADAGEVLASSISPAQLQSSFEKESGGHRTAVGAKWSGIR